jgi:hypothetical protein
MAEQVALRVATGVRASFPADRSPGGRHFQSVRPATTFVAPVDPSERVSDHGVARSRSPMRSRLLWLNGPFGVGKSTVARLLCGRFAATVFEPTGIGHALAKLVPGGRAEDLDDALPLWRSTVVHVANELAHAENPLVILPTTVYRPEHVGEMVNALRSGGTDVAHVVLTAEKLDLASRIHHGPFDDVTKQSHFRHLSPALVALSSVVNMLTIDTTHRSAVDVAATVANALEQRGWPRRQP